MEINGVEMITDRSLSDVEIAKTLIKKGFLNMTESEKKQFSDGLRGAYNYTDFNRVEKAVDYISKYLVNARHDLIILAESLGVAWDEIFDYSASIKVDTKIDWSMSDIITEIDRKRYLQNVVTILQELDLMPSEFPKTLVGLNYNGANLIEKSLVSANDKAKKTKTQKETYIKNTAKSWFYSGDLYGGEA